MLQLLAAAAILAGLLFLTIRTVAESAVERAQDRILGAAALSIAQELRGGQDGVDIDIPYSAFSMLGAMGDDRIFYRIDVGGQTATGYADLPPPETGPGGLDPVFYTRDFRGFPIRIAAVSRSVLVENRQVPILLLIGQTRGAQEAIVADMANLGAALGIGFFVVAAGLAVLTARSVLQPVNSLAEAVARRGPRDLRPVLRPAPAELQPMVLALNGFIARLSAALSRTETFIAEAAHYIRTPLATLRAQSEIALHGSTDPALSDRLRRIIRLADDTARSAGQLLDHAAVIYRTDQRSDEVIDLNALARDVLEAARPNADMRDIHLTMQSAPGPVRVQADPVLIETVIRNLIDNAVKYSHDEGAVAVRVTTTGNEALLQVIDNGRGLGGASQEQLSGRFQRGANAGDVVGSGLGLSIVADVARACGGRFQLHEREEGGTCAEFFMPLC